jgi:AraC-like DNA-binding protein
MGLVTRLAHAHARARGIAVRPLLKKARLTAEQLSDPRSRLPAPNQIDFLNLVAHALDDDLLGVHLALEFELRRAGLFYYVLASANTMQDVLERGARFSSLVNEGVVQEFIHGRRIGLSLRYTGVRRHEDRHQIEFWMVTLMRICRCLSGTHLRPVRVSLSHHRSSGYSKLNRLLGCAVEYSADADKILFAREVGPMQIVNSDPFLDRLLVEMCEEALARQRRAVESFVARVENALTPLLPHGQARAARIAAEFGMSQRTFARRLAGEGLTFSRVLDRLRLELARRYLVNDELSISKVAWLLGYGEVGAFSHAFRRWTGKSPREVARQARMQRR